MSEYEIKGTGDVCSALLDTRTINKLGRRWKPKQRSKSGFTVGLHWYTDSLLEDLPPDTTNMLSMRQFTGSYLKICVSNFLRKAILVVENMIILKNLTMSKQCNRESERKTPLTSYQPEMKPCRWSGTGSFGFSWLIQTWGCTIMAGIWCCVQPWSIQSV